MLSSSPDALIKLSKTSSPQKLFDYDLRNAVYDICIMYPMKMILHNFIMLLKQNTINN